MKKTAIHILLLLACPTTLWGQGIRDSVFTLQPVHVSGKTVFEKEMAGMKETLVDSIVLNEKSSLSLSYILAENTTVYIKNYGRGALATANFRGTAPAHTQVSWNGININSPMLGMVDFSLLPVYIIDELSLQHGAASIAYGNGGLGGHISINNTVDWNNTLSGRYYQGIGSYASYHEFAQVNIGNPKLQLKARAYHSYSKNDYEILNTHQANIDSATNNLVYHKTTNENAAYRKKGILQEIHWRPAKNWFASACFWYQDVERSLPNVLSYEGSDSTYKRNLQNDATIKGVIKNSFAYKGLNVKITNGIDYQQLNYVLKVKVGSFVENMPVNSGSNMLSNYNKIDLNNKLGKYLSLSSNFSANYFDISTFDTASNSGYSKQQLEYSFFIGAHTTLGQHINITAQLRKDWLPYSATPIIYNVGLSYKPMLKKDMVFKLNAARNYHHPTLNDLYWQPGGNPNLLPEEGHTFESGLHFTQQWNKLSGIFQFSAYHSKVNNWILWLPTLQGTMEPQNIPWVISKGFEMNFNGTYQIGNYQLAIRSNYAYTKTISISEIGGVKGTQKQQVPFIPEHSGNVLFSLTRKSTYINYQYHSYGKQNLINADLNTRNSISPFYQLYAIHLNGITLGTDFKKNRYNIGAEIKIHNLFDEVYRTPLRNYMPRRNYMMLLKFKF